MRAVPTNFLIAGALLQVSACVPDKHPSDNTIVVMGYSGAFEDNYKKSVIEPFMAAHPDIKVTYYGVHDAATELGQLRAQKKSPEVNVVITDLSVGNILNREGMLARPDPAALPNYAQLGGQGRELGLLAPPVTYDRLALAYAKKDFPRGVPSWRDLWDPAQAGRIIIPGPRGGDIQTIGFTYVVTHGLHRDPTRDISAGIARIAPLSSAVQTWVPKPDQFTLVAGGAASLAVGWNARGQYFAHRHPDRLGVTIPAEGTVTQVNVIGLIQGAGARDAAETFENYALGATAQAAFSRAMFYIPTNRAATMPDDLAAIVARSDPWVVPVNWIELTARKRAILQEWRTRILGSGSWM
jgi:putative spermidine/putrescine transport system substrate-binding protein